MEVEVLISSLDEGEGEGYMARIWGKSVEMGDRQFFADFYRMNASPVVCFFLCFASFIITGLLFLFLVYFILSHFTSVMLFFFSFFFHLSQVNSVNTTTPVLYLPGKLCLFTLDLGGGDGLEFMFLRD